MLYMFFNFFCFSLFLCCFLSGISMWGIAMLSFVAYEMFPELHRKIGQNN